MEALTTIDSPHLSPLSASELEREIIATRDLDVSSYDTFTERLRITLLGLLAGSLIRDAKMLLRCKQVRINDLERDKYVSCRHDVISSYHSLFPEPDRSVARQPVVIDVTPVKLLNSPAKKRAQAKEQAVEQAPAEQPGS